MLIKPMIFLDFEKLNQISFSELRLVTSNLKIMLFKVLPKNSISI